MCFIISMLGLFFAFNFYMSGDYLLSAGSVVTSIFFITLMVRNILHVKKLRKEKKDDN